MHVSSISAWNFRSFDELAISFPKGFIQILGPNGSGKTNILEAIYYSLTSKSFRSRHDHDLITFQQDFFRIETDYTKDGLKKRIKISFQKDKTRSIQLNDKEYPKAGQLFFETNVVVFTPSSSFLIKGGPNTRRHFLDRIKLKINPEFSLIMTKYKQTLQARNSLLKNISSSTMDHQMYSILTDELIRYSKVIQTERRAMLDLFNTQLKQILSECPLPGVDLLEWLYEPFSNYSDSLHSLLNIESRRGISVIGAHLDQVEVLFNSRLAKDYASEGETKIMTIFSKLCEFQTLEKHTKVTPVMLMDDLSSELDLSNLSKVLSFVINKTQVFVSSLQELPLKADLSISLDKNKHKLCYP
jgi:DNA replication and repair protein RecF